MRPHRFDRQHNVEVGRAFHEFIRDLVQEGYSIVQIEQSVGEHVNAVAQAAYDLGVREIQPSEN